VIFPKGDSIKMGASFRDLIVWQRAIEMCLAVYVATACFPVDERFGLTAQLRRASVSVASNLAEGHGRATTGEFLQFIGVARGSNSEVETQLEIAGRLGFGVPEDLEKAQRLCSECGRLIGGLMKAIRAKTL
jgi:four helix bundle protein